MGHPDRCEASPHRRRRAAVTPGRAAGRGPAAATPTRAAPTPTRRTSAWRSSRSSRRCATMPTATRRDRQRLDLRREVFSTTAGTSGWLPARLEELPGQAGRQSRPLGGALRPGARRRARRSPSRGSRATRATPMNDFVDALATEAADRQRGVARPALGPASRHGANIRIPRGSHSEHCEGTDRGRRGPAVRCGRHRRRPRWLRRRPLRRLGRAQRRARRARQGRRDLPAPRLRAGQGVPRDRPRAPHASNTPAEFGITTDGESTSTSR